jgi:NAD(P)-dependent dehydrogenase (short-subunit alcohol dehydrogenase family)
MDGGADMQIEGCGVVVTGASQGLGAALAAELAGRGARVLLVARGLDKVEEVASGIRRAGGIAHAFAGDVGDKGATHAIAAAGAELVGPVDLLVHNASTLGPTPLVSLLDTECEDLARVLEVNLLGPFRLSKVLVGSMALRGRGLVVHVTSDASISGYPTWGAYGASKAALDQLARIWAAELDGTGVRFVSIDPGEMDTKMHADAMPDADRAALASPGDVARGMVSLLAHGDFASGARLELAREARS